MHTSSTFTTTELCHGKSRTLLLWQALESLIQKGDWIEPIRRRLGGDRILRTRPRPEGEGYVANNASGVMRSKDVIRRQKLRAFDNHTMLHVCCNARLREDPVTYHIMLTYSREERLTGYRQLPSNSHLSSLPKSNSRRGGMRLSTRHEC